jgi:hypothetical protein
LTVIFLGSRLERREDGRSRVLRARRGVTAADPGRAVRGVALGRQPAMRRRVLRRSCQSGRGEFPAGACALPPSAPPVSSPARVRDLRGITRQTVRGALRRSLEAVEKVVTARQACQACNLSCCTSLLYKTAGVSCGLEYTASDLGALGGTRTPNLLIRSQMLYPLSYERRMPR